MKWATQLVSWATMLVVARLLTPTDFGLVGAGSVFVGLVNLISELGLGAAIVQRRDLTEDQIARLGGMAALVGIGLSLVTVAASIPVAGFFRQNAVAGVVAAMSLTFITSGLQVVPRSLMQKGLEFRRLALYDALQAIVGMVTTLGLALAGFRYWSLVLSVLLSSGIVTLVLLIHRPHRLALPREFGTIRSAVTFGWHIVVSRIAWYGYSNADFAIVGRVLGAATLGSYTFGWTMASIPVDRVASLVSRVLPGVFSAIQDDPPALRRYVLRLTEGLAFITFPASIGLFMVGDDLVRVALGNQWEAAILPLRILAFYGGFRSITTIFSFLLIAVGKARLSMLFSLLALMVLPPLFYLGSRWGAPGVAAGWIVGYPIVMIPVYRTVFRIISLRMRDYLKAILPPLGGVAAMVLAIVGLRVALAAAWPAPVRLGAEVAVGAAVYSAWVLLLYRDRFRNLMRIVRGRGEAPAQPIPSENTSGAGS